MSDQLNPNIPPGHMEDKWSNRINELKLISPGNRHRYKIIVIGSGLAGGGATVSLAQMGYQVKLFCLNDSPRRAHSIAAQGGVNAAKNYQGDGDSLRRFVFDTLKGGDFRAREAPLFRLGQLSGKVIDFSVASGAPFAREYGGTLTNRSFGGVQVSRTFYAKGQTGQQLLLSIYASLMQQVARGFVRLCPRSEMIDLVTEDQTTKGVIIRNLISGELSSHRADVVVIAAGGYSNIYYSSTNAISSNASAIIRCYQKGAFFANPSFVQMHPTTIPVQGHYQQKQTLMSESLRNDGRIWVPSSSGDLRSPSEIPEAERDYYLERMYPAFGNLSPRDLASRSAKEQFDQQKGVGPGKNAVYLDFRDALKRSGSQLIKDRYGNLFDMYRHTVGTDPYTEPMQITPSPHFTMGGLWVDYNLMSNIKGLFVLGESSFEYHGANRLGANSLLSAVVDGLYVAPATIPGYLAQIKPSADAKESPVFRDALAQSEKKIDDFFHSDGQESLTTIHKELGRCLWNHVGISKSSESLDEASVTVEDLKNRLNSGVRKSNHVRMNTSLESYFRLKDYFILADLMIKDARYRKESCGAHFRKEYQSPDGSPIRDDHNFCHIQAWKFGAGDQTKPHTEPLFFESFTPGTRSYR